MRRLAAAILALALSAAAGVAMPSVTGAADICSTSTASSFIGLWDSPSASKPAPITTVANIDWNGGSAADSSAWVMLSGVGYLSVAQVGYLACGGTPYFFAAWGSEAGSIYEERNLGSADTSVAHKFRVSRRAGTIRFSIDNVERLRIADVLPWATKHAYAMVESHDGARLPAAKFTNAHTNPPLDWMLLESGAPLDQWFATRTYLCDGSLCGFRVFA